MNNENTQNTVVSLPMLSVSESTRPYEEGKTTYLVKIHFRDTCAEVMSNKIKRMLRHEVTKCDTMFPIKIHKQK